MSGEHMIIQTRQRVEVNTDPQRRCYNGCHYKSEFIWTPWEHLADVTPEKVDYALAWWRDLNAYAVQEQGQSARREFRAVEDV